MFTGLPGKLDGSNYNMKEQTRNGNTKHTVHHLQDGDVIGINQHEHGMGNELLLQTHQNDGMHLNDTVHEQAGGNAIENMHSSPHNADDREDVSFPSRENHEDTTRDESNGKVYKCTARAAQL